MYSKTKVACYHPGKQGNAKVRTVKRKCGLSSKGRGSTLRTSYILQTSFRSFVPVLENYLMWQGQRQLF